MWRGRLLFPSFPAATSALSHTQWLVQESLKREFGLGVVQAKKLRFVYDEGFACPRFVRALHFLLAHSVFSHALERR